MVIEVNIEEHIPQQVEKLEEVIQQLQQHIAYMELRTVPKTPQEIRYLREATARNAIGQLKTLALECKKLSARSTQTYENLTENPELQALEAHLQEEKKHADTLQAQLKSLCSVDRIKRSHEKCTTQQQINMIQSKVMEVTQQLQPVQDKACILFSKIKIQGEELKQVVITAE